MGIQVLAVASVALLLSATSAFADRDVTQLVRSSATGDWNCHLGDNPIGTLSVRATSYVLSRPGEAMAGEYKQANQQVSVTNGPLRGLGVDNGTLVANEPRTLEFPTANGAMLQCSEVR